MSESELFLASYKTVQVSLVLSSSPWSFFSWLCLSLVVRMTNSDVLHTVMVHTSQTLLSFALPQSSIRLRSVNEIMA